MLSCDKSDNNKWLIIDESCGCGAIGYIEFDKADRADMSFKYDNSLSLGELIDLHEILSDALDSIPD